MNTGDPPKDNRSREKLAKVHPALQLLFQTVANSTDVGKFIITEGVRTPERQRELFDAGASRTLKSKHLIGRAVDVAIVVGSEVRWDWPLYERFAQAVKRTAVEELKLNIVWGGDWPKFRDGPHFELADTET